MATVGVDLDSQQLVLTSGRDFKWQFENKNKYNASEDFPAGSLFLEFNTGGQAMAEQSLRVHGASGGTYTLSHDGNVSAPIDFDELTENPTSQHQDILDALEGIPSIGSGNVEVDSIGLYPTWRVELNLDQGHNEVQELEIDEQVVGGEWRVFHGLHITGNIEWDASAAVVQTELEALPSIGVGNVQVTNGNKTTVYIVEFIGALAETPVDALVPSQIGLGWGLDAPDPSGVFGNIGILFQRFIGRKTVVPGSEQLSAAGQALIVQTLRDFFNAFDELLGVDIKFTMTSRINMVLEITSLKRFEENTILSFVMNITANMIEGLFNGIVDFLGVFDTINVDFFWNYDYTVRFVGLLENTEQPALIADASLLIELANTGGGDGDLDGPPEVVVNVVTDGKSQFTFWDAVIVGDTATFHEHSANVAEILPRTSWQLVFAEAGEDDNVLAPHVQGGDPVARGIVTVLK